MEQRPYKRRWDADGQETLAAGGELRPSKRHKAAGLIKFGPAACKGNAAPHPWSERILMKYYYALRGNFTSLRRIILQADGSRKGKTELLQTAITDSFGRDASRWLPTQILRTFRDAPQQLDEELPAAENAS